MVVQDVIWPKRRSYGWQVHSSLGNKIWTCILFKKKVFVFFLIKKKFWEVEQKPRKLAVLWELPNLYFTFRSFAFQQCTQALSSAQILYCQHNGLQKIPVSEAGLRRRKDSKGKLISQQLLEWRKPLGSLSTSQLFAFWPSCPGLAVG